MENFQLRENQKKVINETYNFFKNDNRDIYLWAIKCRWGKTFAAYNLAKKFYSGEPLKILILTYKPTVSKEWKDNLENHIYFKDWRYFTKDNKKSFLTSKASVSVLFMSFQSLISKDSNGTVNFKSSYYSWVGDVDFDFLFVDEAHWGASNPNCIAFCKAKIKSKYRLFMSGTPFTAVKNKYFNYYSAYDCTDEKTSLKIYQVKPSINQTRNLVNFLKDTEFKHIIVYVSDLYACNSMSKSLSKQSRFKVIDCYNSANGCGDAVVQRVQKEVNSNERTVTVTCGMAMTGTTIPQWDCIVFFGCDSKYIPDSPSVFFQTLFRVTTEYKGKNNIAAYFCGSIESLLFKFNEYSGCIASTKRISKEIAFNNLLNSIPIVYNLNIVNYSIASLIMKTDKYQNYVSWYKQKMFLVGINYEEEVA